MFAREYGIGATAETTQAHVEDSMASASTSVWLASGLTSIVAGALLVGAICSTLVAWWALERSSGKASSSSRIS